MMKKATLALWLGALFSGTVSASPADYVYTPTVEYGEHEIDFKYGTARQPDGSLQQATSLGIGYGVNEFWFTEVYLKFEKMPGTQAHFDAVEWENKFQLTETGKYFVDAGLITELEIPHKNGDPYEFKIGSLLQKEYGLLQLNGNLYVERQFHGNTDVDDGPYQTEMGYQLQAKYRWKPALEAGIQALGDLGKWNDWSPRNQQNHRIGPAIFGKVKLENHHAITYNAAWLLGASEAAPGHTFRMQAEYEF